MYRYKSAIGGNRMQTIIELYDDENFCNVLAATVMKPQQVIFVGENRMIKKKNKERIIRYFEKMQIPVKSYFYTVNIGDCDQIIETYKMLINKFPDCAIDVTGGRYLPLLAAGMICEKEKVPVFYFDARKGKFVNIYGCPQAEEFVNDTKFTVDQFVAMAGGMIVSGRNDNALAGEMRSCIKSVWQIFWQKREQWPRFAQFLQKISSSQEHENGLEVDAPIRIRVSGKDDLVCDTEILSLLEKAGVLENLQVKDSRVKFIYRSHQLKSYLSDVGIWLELFAYTVAVESGYFDDVRVRVIVDWDGKFEDPGTVNEIDVIMTKGLSPLFISCKTSMPSTGSLNEIRILADKFGGRFVKPILLTTQNISKASPAVYQRAADLGVYIIQQDDLTGDKLINKLIRLAEI